MILQVLKREKSSFGIKYAVKRKEKRRYNGNRKEESKEALTKVR